MGWFDSEFFTGKPAPSAPQVSGYGDNDYLSLERQSMDYLRQMQQYGSNYQQAAQGFYDQGKRSLDQGLEAQKKFMAEDAARRGVYDSGILTENYNRAYGDYGRGLMDLSGQTEQYRNQMMQQDFQNRMAATQGALSYRPVSYDQWTQQNAMNAQRYQADLANWQQQKTPFANLMDTVGGIAAVASLATPAAPAGAAYLANKATKGGGGGRPQYSQY